MSNLLVGDYVSYGTSIGRIDSLEASDGVEGAYVTFYEGDTPKWFTMSALRPAQQPKPPKPDWTLLPWDVLAEVASVFEVGAGKYGKDNWADKDNLGGDHLKKAMGHLVAHMQGEEIEDQATGGSGLRHLSHAIARLIMVVGREVRLGKG